MVSRVAPQLYSDADKVRRLIAEYVSIDVKQVTDETHLTDDLGLDWLDQLELLVLIEDEFAGVEFFATRLAISNWSAISSGGSRDVMPR